MFSAPTGTPELVPGTEQRQDSWALDSVGNWAGLENVVGDWNGDTRADNFDVSAFLADFNATPPDPRTDLNGDTLFTQADVDAFLDAVDFGRSPGRQSIGNLDGYGTPWALSNAAAGVDTHEYNQAVGITNEIEEVIEYGSGLGGPIAHAYDAAGNLRFDGTYVYQYDAWNRLVQVNQASWDAQAGAPVVGALVKRWVYDAFGRVVQTRSPITGGEYEERFVYDGVRRVQEWVTDTSVVSPAELLEREYVWGFGGGTDELLVEFDGFGTSYWPIQDVSGDVVALCDLNGTNGTARVVGQWTYDAYGEVLTAEHIGSFPVRHVGHKGLFVDRLDGVILSSSTEQPRTIPFAHVVYQNRNRAYAPRSGRFLQRDPNQTALQLLSGGYNGRGTAAIALAFSFEGMYGDGFNLYQYLGGNPLLRRDPMGLSYDPFDMLDDFMAEYLGSASAFLSQLGQDVQAAAVVGLNVLSMMPFPGVSIVGDVGLYLAGEQGLAMTVGMIALGLVPGGKLIGKAVGKVGPVIANLGAKAWKYATAYAVQFGGAVLRGGARLGRWAGGMIGSLANRVGSVLRRKPPELCGCFVAGTLVWTASGAVPIEELRPDDYVLAAPDDSSSLDYAASKIAMKLVVGEASLVLLTIRHDDGSVETLETTDEHPFYDTYRGWTRADGLRPGDALATATGEAIVVSLGYDGRRVPVFNLSVPRSPTYYVGTHGVWVHNCVPIGVPVPFREARKATKGLGGELQAYHLVEQRHFDWGVLGGNKHDVPGVVLSRDEHQEVTNRLRELLPYGEPHSKSDVYRAYQEAYRARPGWLEAVEPFFR